MDDSKSSISLSSNDDRAAQARDAYNTHDVEMMRRVHDDTKVNVEQHRSSGDYIKSMIFGGLDGSITIFAIVASISGGAASQLTVDLVLVLGFAKLVADALSMGTGDYLSDRAEADYAQREKNRETWEFENYPKGEIEEMVEIYMKKGFDEQTAREILECMSKNRDFFVDHMMVEELGILPPDPDDSPAKAGLITFCSFVLFGFMPLLIYLAFHGMEFEGFDPTFLLSIILTLITLSVLGALQAFYGTARYLVTIAKTVFNGVLAAAVSYLIGWGLGELLETVVDD